LVVAITVVSGVSGAIVVNTDTDDIAAVVVSGKFVVVTRGISVVASSTVVMIWNVVEI